VIGKQVKGKGFRGCLNYLLGKQGSQIIGGNMAGQNPRALAAEFRVSRQLNPQVQRAVYHTSLSVRATEQLDDEQWKAIASDYLEGMGFDYNQYLIVRHSDTDHNHIHIIASRIRLDGSCVSDSWDYHRSERLIRQLEQKYQLQPALSSWDKERRSPTTGERRLHKRTGSDSKRQQLQETIDQASQDKPSMPLLVERLKHQGINAQVKFTRTLKVKGISYELGGMAFSGTKLGKAYTFPGLQKYRGIDYNSDRDDHQLQRLNEVEPQFIKRRQKVLRGTPRSELALIDPVQRSRVQVVAPTVDALLTFHSSQQFRGKRYTAKREEQELVLERNEPHAEILRAVPEANRSRWQPTSIPQLTEADVENMRLLKEQLRQAEIERSRNRKIER